MAEPVRDPAQGDRFNDPVEAVEMTGAWMNVAFGVLVVATPLFLALGGVGLWNALLSGLAVIVLASVTWWAANRSALDVAKWSAGANVLVGLWVLMSPFVLGVGGFYLWALVTLGLLVAFTAAYNAWEARAAPEPVYGRSRA